MWDEALLLATYGERESSWRLRCLKRWNVLAGRTQGWSGAGLERLGKAMTNERRDDNGTGQDRVLDGVVRWDLGMGSSHANEILWRCDATRAGRLYDRTLFGTREEAEEFAAKMRMNEPDQMFNVEAIKASTVWN